MNLFQVLILAIIQGAAELLPVSSSAHVIVAEKLMGLDPTAPQLTLLLVMLHTGTMFAVIATYWKKWQSTYFSSMEAFRQQALLLIVATIVTGVVGLGLQFIIKHVFFKGADSFEIEHLFGNHYIIASGLACAGVLIMVSSRLGSTQGGDISTRRAAIIGAVQGLCLPFRGFSRSGATISTGLALNVARHKAEEFSFALAVVLTPAVVVKEVLRLAKMPAESLPGGFMGAMAPSLLGMVLAFAAGMAALRWVARWLEQGRWYLFGAYCLVASVVVLWVG